MKPNMKFLRDIKQRIHGWGFELTLIQRVHNISRYWTSGEIRKEGTFTKPVRAVVLSPHPDDESIGCGGTIAHIIAAGGSVDVIYMTKGEQGREDADESEATFTARRVKEAATACGILGVDKTFYLNGNDGKLLDQPEISEQLSLLLDDGKYDVIFSPWPYDSHSDHEGTYKLFRRAMQLCISPIKKVWLYEVWSPLHANRIVNIDATIDRKCDAIRAYESQHVNNDLTKKVTALAQYRSIHLPEANHAEAFLVMDGSDLELLP